MKKHWQVVILNHDIATLPAIFENYQQTVPAVVKSSLDSSGNNLESTLFDAGEVQYSMQACTAYGSRFNDLEQSLMVGKSIVEGL